MEYTIEDIFEMKQPHPLGGYQTSIDMGKYVISIVGGGRGLYGDFKTTFELAVIDQKSGDFVTQKLIPSADGEVMGWVDKEQLMDIINSIF
jgi:hypothetical protein